jgi:hypothetical protein
MQEQICRRPKTACETIPSKTQNAAEDTGAPDPNNNLELPAMHRHPTQLPNPWLFDSEKLLRELDRCREQVLQIPCNGDLHATHFGINLAISAIWNLSEQIRYLLHLHREGQRAFAQKTNPDYQHQCAARPKVYNFPPSRLRKNRAANKIPH